MLNVDTVLILDAVMLIGVNAVQKVMVVPSSLQRLQRSSNRRNRLRGKRAES